MSTPEQLKIMGKAILDFEARRDHNGHLEVYELPSGDGGGKIEVAGINDRFHPSECSTLVAMLRSGHFTEAESFATDFFVRYTNVVPTWEPSNMDPGVEFYLRDTAFNRGPTGAAIVLQMALGVMTDGKVGAITKGALATSDPKELLVKLRAAREKYEHRFRDERSKFWKGLVNRWNNALTVAHKLQEPA